MTRRYLVVYHHLPHYRYAVFKALDETPGYDFHYAADSSSRDGTIPTLGTEHLRHVHLLNNRWLGNFLWQEGLFNLLRQPWDGVIFLGDFAGLSTWSSALYLRLRCIPVYFWTIGWHKPENGLKKWFRLAFYSLANRLLLYGNVGQHIGTSMGYPADKMGVIFNSSGGPHEHQESTTVEVGAPSTNPFIIGAVIRLNPVKRLDLLIHAASLLEQRHNWPVRVVILGEGPDRARLEGLARRLSVELELPGAAYDENQIRAFYERASLTVVPSVAGLSVTQSLRYGRPTITHDNIHEQAPEAEAIIEGVTGGLYEFGHVDSLAEKISYWLEAQESDWHSTMDACHAEIDRRWSGGVHAQAIIRELKNTEVS